MSDLENRLRFNVHVMGILRNTTRPLEKYPGSILSNSEVKELRDCYALGWSADDFARLLQLRDEAMAAR